MPIFKKLLWINALVWTRLEKSKKQCHFFFVYFYLQCNVYAIHVSSICCNIFRPVCKQLWDHAKSNQKIVGDKQIDNGSQSSMSLTKPQKWPARARDVPRPVCVVEKPWSCLAGWVFSRFTCVHRECPCLISQIMNERVADVTIMCSAGRHLSRNILNLRLCELIR